MARIAHLGARPDNEFDIWPDTGYSINYPAECGISGRPDPEFIIEPDAEYEKAGYPVHSMSNIINDYIH